MSNTAYVPGGKPITILLQSISGVSAINSLVTFYDIHGGKREVLFFYFVPLHHTRLTLQGIINIFKTLHLLERLPAIIIIVI
jgi:hypothetical protein